MVWVLLSASVERFSVSRLRDFSSVIQVKENKGNVLAGNMITELEVERVGKIEENLTGRKPENNSDINKFKDIQTVESLIMIQIILKSS